MSYTLIGHPFSPFVRTCHMFMLKNNLPVELKVLNFLTEKEDIQALANTTPINKIPVLIDGDQKIFDSRVIFNYLTEKHNWRRFTVTEENLLTSVYSCLDSTMNLFNLKRDGFDINAPGLFLKRNRERIPTNLEFIGPWVRTLNPRNPEDWNYISMTLFSYLYWDNRRPQMTDMTAHPVMTKFMQDFANAPGVAQTSF
jgi:glutathione S-transferase